MPCFWRKNPSTELQIFWLNSSKISVDDLKIYNQERGENSDECWCEARTTFHLDLFCNNHGNTGINENKYGKGVAYSKPYKESTKVS